MAKSVVKIENIVEPYSREEILIGDISLNVVRVLLKLKVCIEISEFKLLVWAYKHGTD